MIGVTSSVAGWFFFFLVVSCCGVVVAYGVVVGVFANGTAAVPECGSVVDGRSV